MTSAIIQKLLRRASCQASRQADTTQLVSTQHDRSQLHFLQEQLLRGKTEQKQEQELLLLLTNRQRNKIERKFTFVL